MGICALHLSQSKIKRPLRFKEPGNQTRKNPAINQLIYLNIFRQCKRTVCHNSFLPTTGGWFKNNNTTNNNKKQLSSARQTPAPHTPLHFARELSPLFFFFLLLLLLLNTVVAATHFVVCGCCCCLAKVSCACVRVEQRCK